MGKQWAKQRGCERKGVGRAGQELAKKGTAKWNIRLTVARVGRLDLGDADVPRAREAHRRVRVDGDDDRAGPRGNVHVHCVTEKCVSKNSLIVWTDHFIGKH